MDRGNHNHNHNQGAGGLGPAAAVVVAPNNNHNNNNHHNNAPRNHNHNHARGHNNNNHHGNNHNHHNHRPTNFEFILGGIVKVPVSGHRSTVSSKYSNRRKLLKRLRKAYLGYGDQNLYSSRQFIEGSNKYEEFFCYNENQDDGESDNDNNDESGASGADVSMSDDERDGNSVRSRRPPCPAPGSASLLNDVSINIVDLLSSREIGNATVPINLPNRIRIGPGAGVGAGGSTSGVTDTALTFQSQPDFPIKHLLINGILQEKAIRVENLNKVFCSQWLSDRQVIFGTKCNKLMVLDVQTKHLTQIPSLTPSTRSLAPDQQCGIHSIQINPSRTLLATGGKNPNDLAIYKLPTMDPYCVGELAHIDWVFAQAWLDDQFLVSGSRDTSLALWKIPDEEEMKNMEFESESCDASSSFVTKKKNSAASSSASTSSSNSTRKLHGHGHSHDEIRIPSHFYIRAAAVKECKSAQKVRDIVFNRRSQEIACVSLNGYLHVWAADRFVQKFSRKLPFTLENVCMAVHEDYGLYAVGSKSHTTLMDSRTIQCVKKIPSKYTGLGIRSTSFFSSLLSIGTGQGTVMFYDLRAAKYLESNINSARSAILKPSVGWTYPEEEMLLEQYRNNKYLPAVYTHCVDGSGTRIFTAGGPLPITQYGNYIGLWH